MNSRLDEYLIRMRSWQLLRRLGSAGLLAGAILLAACSTTKEDEAYKRSKSLPPLEVPPDLVTPQQDQTMAVPKLPEAKPVATAKPAVVEAEAGAGKTRARLISEGAQRWLSVTGSAADVMAEVRVFLLKNGMDVALEDPTLGSIETAWLGAASGPATTAEQQQGSGLDQALRASLQDKYRIHVAAAVEPGSVELRLSHLGLQRMAVDGKLEWQSRAADPLLEAEMLQRLQLHFNAAGTAAEQKTAAAEPSEQVARDTTLVEDHLGDVTLLIKEDFDRSWRRVGIALERAGFVISDRNRSTGVYEIKVGQAFKGDQEGSLFMRLFGGSAAFAPDTLYRVVLKGGDDKTTVLLRHGSGGPEHGGMSRRVLTKIRNNME